MDGTNSTVSSSSNLAIELPGKCDVLLGRGRPLQEHPGNQRFRTLVDSYVEQYESSKKRKEKTELTELVLETIQREGGRFVQMEEGSNGSKSSGLWYEVSDAVARDKVSHAFRTQRQKLKARKKLKK